MLRRIRPGDSALLRAIRLRTLSTDPDSFGSTFASESAYPDAFWEARSRHYATAPDAAIFFSGMDDVADGIVRTARDEAHAGVFDVHSLWVAPEARGRGVAAALLTAAEDFARRAGGRFAELDVIDTATAARLLYSRAGYLPEGTASVVRPGVMKRRMRKSLRP